MGMSFESVVFHRPAGEAWQTLQPKLEELLQAYGLGPVYESSDGTSGVVYDTEMSAEEDMPELVCAVSALTGGTAIGAVCLDSDFVGVVLARNGEQMDMGYIGVPYGAEEEEGLELHTAQLSLTGRFTDLVRFIRHTRQTLPQCRMCAAVWLCTIDRTTRQPQLTLTLYLQQLTQIR